jgi:hypothetical protein
VIEDEAISPAETLQRGVEYEGARRLPEAAECYLLAGSYSDAARVLNHLGWFYEAGLSLLLYLPPGESVVLRLPSELRRTCLDASVCFARAGARPEVVALLTSLGERTKAANLLVRAGLRQRAAALMRGDHSADSPWRPGVIGPLATRTGVLRRVQALALRSDPSYQPILQAPTAGTSGGFVRRQDVPPYVPERAPASPPPQTPPPWETEPPQVPFAA